MGAMTGGRGDRARRPEVRPARVWARAIRRPWLAAASAVATAVVIIELLRLLVTPLEQVSAPITLLLVLGTPTLVATLPRATLRWRVAAPFVGLQVGTILNAPVETLSLSAYRESFIAAFAEDGRGLLVILVCTLIALPFLEAAGAWFRRRELASEPHEASGPTS
jgi:hypothetical protein